MQSQTAHAALTELLDVGELVPDCYAAYRPVAREALFFFLQHLRPERQQSIAEEQMALPQDSSLTERIFALLHRCPSLHKLGQVLAHDRSLSPDLLIRLQALESMPPSIPHSAIAWIIKQEIGRPHGLELAPRLLAEASVAAVLPFTWKPSATEASVQGVFKVLKPGISELLQEELEIWAQLGGFLEERCTSHHLPQLSYRETFDQLRSLLLREIQPQLEQSNLKRAASFFADSPDIWIPKILPLCTSRITAMEYIPGRKVTEASHLSEDKRRKLAETMLTSLLAKPMWDPEEISFFHADPHGGNLLLSPDGRLGILDWSLLTSLDKEQRSGLVQIALAALSLDEASVCQRLEDLAASVPKQEALKAVVAREIGRLRSGAFPGFSWLLGLLDRAATEAGLNFPESMALFRKALHTLLGLTADVSESCSPDSVLLGSGLRQFAMEWPQRMVSPAYSRSFGTHVSTADIAGLLLASPLLPLKAWNGWWQDALQSHSH